MSEPSGAEGRGLSDRELEVVRNFTTGFMPETDWDTLNAVSQRFGGSTQVALLAHIDALLAELERGAAREAALREALEFYANEETWEGNPTGEWESAPNGYFEVYRRDINRDEGRRAREALAGGKDHE